MKAGAAAQPISDPLDTRRRLKVAARRLFAERGVEAVTVRDIVNAAGAKNGGSLNYYFGTKDGLVLELVSDLIRENAEELLSAIALIERDGGAPLVRDVMEVLVKSFRPRSDPSPTAARFLCSVLFTRRRIMRDFMSTAYFPIYMRMLGYVERDRPDLPLPVLRQRWIYLAWFLASSLSAYEAYLAQSRHLPIWTDCNPLENLIDAAAGMVGAPVEAVTLGRVSRRANPLRRALRPPTNAM
ncbi:MAG: TetR/AcrR family transcriptional regulator [Sphingomonadales bacterium]|nr:MAG: TetR/AcrR family transcriptional regulator [Sphingomonadales bacterium]